MRLLRAAAAGVSGRRGGALRARAAAASSPAGCPLPPRQALHRVLRAPELRPGRVVIVGDVHGCADELDALLAAVAFDAASDNLLLVGDLVNKGPASARVVAAVRGWASSNDAAWAVRGNHDDAALAAALAARRGGGGDTRDRYRWVAQLSDDDVAFLAALPFSLELPDFGIAVVHAGLLPGVPLRRQRLEHLTKLRDLSQQPDGSWEGLEKGRAGSVAWAQRWQGPHHVFFGHDAKRGLQRERFATGLDSGCVYGGALSAAVIPSLVELRARRPRAAGWLRLLGRRRAPTLEELAGTLVSVPAAAVHEQPGARAAADAGRGGSAGGGSDGATDEDE
ncbi:apaH [Scenedesmus sp. PABB004]|nr:apaH [Scenedesmus sp. PABB004]